MTDSKMREALLAAKKIIANPHGYTETSVIVADALLGIVSQSVPVVGEVVAWSHDTKTDSCVITDSVKKLLLRCYGDATAASAFATPLIVQPTHSISADELERLKHCRKLLKEARDDVVETLNCMRASYRDSPRNKTRLDKQCEFLKQIDAAIAAEGEKE